MMSTKWFPERPQIGGKRFQQPSRIDNAAYYLLHSKGTNHYLTLSMIIFVIEGPYLDVSDWILEGRKFILL